MHGERRWDALIGRLASRQHGVVARRQLEGLGVPRGVIEHRVRKQWLVAVHRGVYGVGHAGLSREGRWLAAVLAAGEDAVLSHGSAAALWGVASEDGPIEVSAPTARRAVPGYVAHRSPVARDERTRRNGIPVTTIARTILDLAATTDRRGLERIYREAEVQRLANGNQLARLLARHPRRPGTRAARELIGDTITKSDLEKAFRRFLRAHDIPLPDETNTRLPWGEADCVWHAAKLNIELDGFGVHKTRSAFERDRLRDRKAAAAGWTVVRVTWRQLHDEAAALATDLRGLTGGT